MNLVMFWQDDVLAFFEREFPDAISLFGRFMLSSDLVMSVATET